MTVIDQILNEWSFRCHDGIVDMNDPTKVSILQEIIQEYELEEAMLSLKSIKKRPDQFSNKFYNNSSFRIGTKGEDEFIIDYVVIGDEVFKSENKEEKSNLVGAFRSASSARDVKLIGKLNGQETTLNINTLYKSADLGGQEGGSRGVSNENELVNAINTVIDSNDNNPITIKFIAEKGPEITILEVKKAENIGYAGKKTGMKGDVMLYTSSTSQSISVKKDGPYWWSSERQQFAGLLNKFVEEGKKGNIDNLILKENPLQPYVLDMIDPKDNRRYGVVLIKNYPSLDNENEISRIAFGSEQSKIIQRSFSESDFNFENNILTIKTTRNIASIEDLTEDDKPIIWLARHENQKYGIDFRTIPYSQAKFEPKKGGKTLVIDYNNTPSLQ
jgi:hypothetical protein